MVVCCECRDNGCKGVGLCSKRNCRANQVRELEAGRSRRHWRSKVSVLVPNRDQSLFAVKSAGRAYLSRIMIVLWHARLVRVVDWCWWMISLKGPVRRNVCVDFWPIIGIFPLKRWRWTWRIEGRRVWISVLVVRRRHLGTEK